MSPKALWDLLRCTAGGFSQNRASSMGAAIAYYTVFSMAPLVLIIISIAGLIFGQQAAAGALFGELRELLGDRGAQTVQAALQSVQDVGSGVTSLVIGVFTLALGATTVFAELQADLDHIWKAPPPARNGALSFLRTRLLSFGVVLVMGFLLIVSLLLSASISAAATLVGGWFGEYEPMLQLLNFVFSFAIITVMFAMIYRLLPSVSIQWRDVWVGAAVTSLLFSIGKFLIGLYVGRAAVASSFGAAGALVVILLWVYYSAQIFLFGAEFTYQFAHRHGSLSSKPGTRSAQTAAAPSSPAHLRHAEK